MGRAFEFRKARKFKRWAAMAKAFTRCSREITMAAKDGGGDPNYNLRLRSAIQNAKAENMPKDTIDRAIKKALDKDASSYEELVYEGYAPNGIAVIIETATDNHIRTVANVRSYFNKTNGNLAKSGSVEFLFERKCFFEIEKPEMEIDELELELIDFGVEELFEEEEENTIMLYGQFSDFGNIQKALDEKSLVVRKSGFERIPMEMKMLGAEEAIDVDKLLEKLDGDDDVQNVYHNMGYLES